MATRQSDLKAALVTCAKAPCKSCPYRRDVPSGVWAAVEYDKLPTYDGGTPEQLEAGGLGLFMCHTEGGKLCAGWVGCHDMNNLLAVRLSTHNLDPALWDYKSPVPLFESGAAAAAHGKRAIRRPGVRAKRTMERLLRKRRKPS